MWSSWTLKDRLLVHKRHKRINMPSNNWKNMTCFSDPYVKVYLICAGRRLKKRKTTIKKSTLNPAYNEAIVFDIPPENVEQVSLSIMVMDYDRCVSRAACCKHRLHIANYYPSVTDWLLSICLYVCLPCLSVGHNEVIGVCRTGPDAEGLGRDHWNEMLAYPRKPITHWHALGEVNTFVRKLFIESQFVLLHVLQSWL